jgi:hypothetical protein
VSGEAIEPLRAARLMIARHGDCERITGQPSFEPYALGIDFLRGLLSFCRGFTLRPLVLVWSAASSSGGGAIGPGGLLPVVESTVEGIGVFVAKRFVQL